MSKEKIDILKDEVVIPGVVTTAAEGALDKILRETLQEKEQEKMEVALVRNRKSKFKKRWIAVAAVAVLVVGTLSVGAAGGFNGSLLEFMGISASKTDHLVTEQIEIGASDTCKGVDYSTNPDGEKKEVTMTISECMGDSNIAYIRVDTDYELSEELQLAVDNVRFDSKPFKIYSDKSMTKEAEMIFDSMQIHAYNENGKLGVMLKIVGCEDINEKYMYWPCEDIYLLGALPGDEKTLLFDGEWELKWQLAYDATRMTSYPLDTDIHLPYAKVRKAEDSTILKKGLDVHLTKIELTPMTIKLWATCDYDAKTEQLANTGFRLEKITYSDGTKIEFDEANYREKMSAYGYNAFFNFDIDMSGDVGVSEIFVTELFGQDIDITKVESITIDGVEISVN